MEFTGDAEETAEATGREGFRIDTTGGDAKSSSTRKRAISSTCWPTSHGRCLRLRVRKGRAGRGSRLSIISIRSSSSFWSLCSGITWEWAWRNWIRKLGPLLRLKYGGAFDAVAVLGDPEEIRGAFVGFQKYLYESAGGD